MTSPYLFDEFFAAEKDESISPFLTRSSRKWGKNLAFRSAATAGVLLALAFVLPQPASYFCLTLVFFLSGIPSLLDAIRDLRNLEINIDVLMTLAAFMAVLIGSPIEGALLLVLFELSHGMEESVTKKAKSAIHNLNNIAPKFAQMIDESGRLYEKSVKEIACGEKMLVKFGEIVPLDGIVLEGASSINLVHLTGESVPVSTKIGDSVPAGARNFESAFTLQVTRTSSDSTLARIVQLITDAQEAKPKLQRFLDKFGKYYATSIITLTFSFMLILPFFMSQSDAIYRALAFLIAASPCALIIATPTAYLSAISACAKKGILLKGGIALDALASCKTIAFDKTGTLTTGELEAESFDVPENVLSIAYGLERQFVHPIATAICRLAQKKGLQPTPIQDFTPIPGKGVEGKVNGQIVQVGSPEFIGLSVEDKHHTLAAIRVGEEKYLLRFVDKVRDNIQELIQALPLKTVMLTGDHEENALRVGKVAGIQEIYHSLKPEDKLEKVSQLATSGLAMVGDGINDAPALARATVGISMGKIGSSTAVDASDVVLLNDDLPLLSWLFKRAHKTTRIVKQNITLALTIILLASTPALLGAVPLWLAVLLHEGGTVLVGLNSLRLLRK